MEVESNAPALEDGMQRFAELVIQLGTSTKTNDKLEALAEYFSYADGKDKVWVIALFSGRRPKRSVNSTQLQNWCVELTGIPQWLFEESYHTVGDLAETIALLISSKDDGLLFQPATHLLKSTPATTPGSPQISMPFIQTQSTYQGKSSNLSPGSLSYYIEKLVSIAKETEQVKKQFVLSSWVNMNSSERFVFNKLITGGFRIGVSQQMMVNALARIVSLEPAVIAHRIAGNWDPSITSFEDLLIHDITTEDQSKPYPFYLAYALEDDPANLGEPGQWQAEWKWDGIRGQLIKRNDELFVWSRGEELITDRFPEYFALKDLLPNGTVIDGEIVPAINGKPLPFALLQTRIGRKTINKKQLQEVPVTFFAYDLLEHHGEDWRDKNLPDRRKKLEELVTRVAHSALWLSPVIKFSSWQELAEIRHRSRDAGSEGLMLKRKDSTYLAGRKRGDWWKWKIDPLTIDAVMIYAQKGHGRRSNLYTDYTFAVKDGEKLVSFTKAYSGLTDKEFLEVDAFVKRNSLEKFGPVRTVKPELVFEIAFEGIAASSRHKSGVALRFPRINRWRKDKTVGEINTLEDLKKMLEVYGK
jgi:DNA ligase 1